MWPSAQPTHHPKVGMDAWSFSAPLGAGLGAGSKTSCSPPTACGQIVHNIALGSRALEKVRSP